MKVLFGTNVTQNKKNTEEDGRELIIRTVPESYYEAFKENDTEEVDSDRNTRLNKLAKTVLKIFLRCFFGVTAFISLAGVMASIGEESETFKDLLASVKDCFVLFLLSFCGLLISLFVLYRIKKSERDAEEKFYEETDEKIERENKEFERAVYDFLDIPSSAQTVEIIVANYKIKNGEVCLKPGIISFFLNNEIKMFARNKTLYLADEENCYALSLEGEKKIFKVKGKLTLLCWNKEQSYKEGKFKEFGIKRTPTDNYIIKEYCFLEIEISGETYRLYFPPYELKKIVSVTGAKVQE